MDQDQYTPDEMTGDELVQIEDQPAVPLHELGEAVDVARSMIGDAVDLARGLSGVVIHPVVRLTTPGGARLDIGWTEGTDLDDFPDVFRPVAEAEDDASSVPGFPSDGGAGS